MEVIITGLIKAIHPTVERSGYKSRKVWIEIDRETQYPQTLEVELGGDRVGIIEQYDVAAGDICDVSMNLRGRTWTSPQGEVKCFNTLSAWKIVIREWGEQHTEAPVTASDPVISPTNTPVIDPADDLPF